MITEDKLHQRNMQYLLRRNTKSSGLSEKICNSLYSSYSVMSLSKPCADLDTIVSPSHFKTDNFLKSNVIIVCGGTRDISRNGTNKGLRCFKQFSMKTSNANLIILDASHHHDLEKKLCVNKEAIIFNGKLHKLMKSFQHVRLLIMNMSRHLFMKPGLHMNSCGKFWTSGIIVKSISVISLTKQDRPPRNLAWPN